MVLAPKAITSWCDNNKTYTGCIHRQHNPDTCGSDITVEEECSKKPGNRKFAMRLSARNFKEYTHEVSSTQLPKQDLNDSMLHISSSLLQGVEISPVIVENPVKGLMTLVQSLLGHFTPLTSTDSFLMQLQYQHATKSIKRIFPSCLAHSLISAFLPSQQTCICCKCPALEHTIESEDTPAALVNI